MQASAAGVLTQGALEAAAFSVEAEVAGQLADEVASQADTEGSAGTEEVAYNHHKEDKMVAEGNVGTEVVVGQHSKNPPVRRQLHPSSEDPLKGTCSFLAVEEVGC